MVLVSGLRRSPKASDLIAQTFPLIIGLSGYIPSSALIAVLLVVLGHPSSCTIFLLLSSVLFLGQLFYRLCVSLSILLLHALALGRPTFVRMHLLILVSGCECLRTASVSPTCALYAFFLPAHDRRPSHPRTTGTEHVGHFLRLPGRHFSHTRREWPRGVGRVESHEGG